jgi:hypothetical protein
MRRRVADDEPLVKTAVAARRGASCLDARDLPAELQSALHGLLNIRADAEAVHAELALHLVLFAKEALAFGERDTTRASCVQSAGLTSERMRQYALIASRWTEADLRRLLVERRNRKGQRISVSHLYEIAKLRAPRATRESWLERVFSENMTVRFLRRALRESLMSSTGANGAL